MATLSEIQTAVNNRLATFWGAFRTKQTAYKAVTGRYWQGLVYSSVPDDGATVTPNLSLVAGKENTSWTTFLNGDLPAPVEAQARCDTYEEPGAIHGYRFTVRVSKAGVTYERVAEVRNAALVTTGTWVQV